MEISPCVWATFDRNHVNLDTLEQTCTRGYFLTNLVFCFNFVIFSSIYLLNEKVPTSSLWLIFLRKKLNGTLGVMGAICRFRLKHFFTHYAHTPHIFLGSADLHSLCIGYTATPYLSLFLFITTTQTHIQWKRLHCVYHINYTSLSFSYILSWRHPPAHLPLSLSLSILETLSHHRRTDTTINTNRRYG